MNSDSEENWDKAFLFFEKRIKTRYLNPIKRIQCMNRNIGEGFAIVNLQCSLIETIESFYNGWIYKYPDYLKKEELAFCPWDSTKKISSEAIFISFFKERELFKNGIEGHDFYIRIRCGLLHETQTKGGWIIKRKSLNKDVFYEQVGNRKIIYRNNFQKALEKVIQEYKMAIIKGGAYDELNRVELRENFKAKFEHICEISKP